MVNAVESESLLLNQLSCNVPPPLTIHKRSLKVHEAKQFNLGLSPHALSVECTWYFYLWSISVLSNTFYNA